MKNMLLIMALVLSIGTQANTSGTRSSLEIVSQAGLITVAVDHQYFGQPTTHFSVENIKSGNRYVEIFGSRNQYGYNSKVRLFSGRIYVQPGSRVIATFDPARGFVVQAAEYYAYQNTGQYGYEQYDSYNAPVAMSSPQFSTFLKTVAEQWTENNRLQVALQGLQYNYLTTWQVKEIMETFWTESARLEFAKAAYLRVVDPQVYYEVNEVFWSSVSVQKLSSYILSIR